ncbi:hypothetical protein scyTo_0005630 [Scyliorhinus torazame]|uniref:Uncharacterized protein n=1 Tax=Scyliorhinus torazame TaxID=75743 RepID=A0A401PAS1_SCYTO|nr:hypothetical protein [Scyliorhinus torazame]
MCPNRSVAQNVAMCLIIADADNFASVLTMLPDLLRFSSIFCFDFRFPASAVFCFYIIGKECGPEGIPWQNSITTRPLREGAKNKQKLMSAQGKVLVGE